MDKKDIIIIALFLTIVCESIGVLYVAKDLTRLEPVDQNIINQAITNTYQETGTNYTLIPVYINTGEHIGFLSDINNSGYYMYLGLSDYPSIFQGGN